MDLSEGTAKIVSMTDTYNGGPTAEMREEMKQCLRSSGDGLEHGAVLRLMEQGMDVDEIAAQRATSAASIRAWMRSLDQLFTGARDVGSWVSILWKRFTSTGDNLVLQSL